MQQSCPFFTPKPKAARHISDPHGTARHGIFVGEPIFSEGPSSAEAAEELY